MNGFLLAAAGFILATVALGLVRILGGPGDADRMMAAVKGAARSRPDASQITDL